MTVILVDFAAVPTPTSSTKSGSARRIPRHVAIIMDGNGRWAVAQGKPRVAGIRAASTPCVRRCRRAASAESSI